MNNTIAIAGLGWLGQPFAYRLASFGYTVKGSVTTVEKATLLQQSGFDAYPVEISENGIVGEHKALLRNINCLVIMIPPGLRKNTGSDYVLKMAHLLVAITEAAVSKVILVSSTSVYADSQGKVTENDEPKPETIAGKQLRQVEELFFHSDEIDTAIVRFGGLIGGNRNPAKYLAGRTDLTNGNAPVNLIHREDCINILMEIVKQDAYGHIFNAVNPNHPQKSSYYIQKTQELGLVSPTFAPGTTTEIFKQVDSLHVKSILDYTFKFSI